MRLLPIIVTLALLHPWVGLRIAPELGSRFGVPSETTQLRLVTAA